MNTPSKNSRVIRLFFPIFFGLVFLGLGGRLFYLQIIRHEKYESLALDQQTWEITVDPSRGSIKDVNGVDLAVSATAYQVLMAPSQLTEEDDCKEVAQFLSQTLDLNYDTVYGYTQKNSQYLAVKRRIEKRKPIWSPNGFRNIKNTKPPFGSAKIPSGIILTRIFFPP